MVYGDTKAMARRHRIEPRERKLKKRKGYETEPEVTTKMCTDGSYTLSFSFLQDKRNLINPGNRVQNERGRCSGERKEL